MEYLFNIGFLGTRAPYYIDTIMVYLLLLPILILFSIFLATNKYYGLHRFLQTILFLFTLISVIIFNYTLHMVEDCTQLIAMRSIEYNQAFYLLVAQTMLSILMLILWLSTLLFAIADRRRKALPGLYSRSHKISGRRVFVVLILTVVTTLYLYWVIYAN